jgi:outer membrane protein TolC
VLFSILAGCSVREFTRPEGDGGWSSDRRQRELAARVVSAGVTPLEHPPASERAADTASLDLPTALTLATERNRSIAVARAEVDAARARVADARGRLLPATTGSGRYTWYSDEQTTEIDRRIGQQLGFTPTVTVRSRDFGVVNGTVMLPLDLSGEIRAILHAAQAGYRGERARLWATTLAQEARVVSSYLQLLEAQRLRTVAEQTVAVDREQLRNTQSRFDGGRVTKNELLVVQVALRNAEQALLQRTQAIDAARWQLNDAVGLSVDADVQLADVVATPQLPETDSAITLAWQNNPVVTSLLEEQQRLDATVTALERSRFPRFSGGGAVDYTSSTISTPQQFESGFVGFTLDLGTDTRREAQIAEARAAAERNRESFERQLRELETAIRRTQQAVVERIAAQAAAENAVGQAEENLRIRQQQFDVGRAESADVLDAEALLASQQATVASARYQAHARRAELQQLMGLPMADLWPEEGSRVQGFKGPSQKDESASGNPRTLEPSDPRTLSSAE